MKKIMMAMTTFVLFLTGCGAKAVENANALSVAGIYKAGDQTWFIDEGKSSETKVTDAGGTFQYMDAQMNPDKYLSLIDDAILKGVQGMLICTPDQQLSEATMEKANAANIPVIAVDDPLIDSEGKYLAPWVGIDSYTIGSSAGEWIANYAKENGMDKDEKTGVLIMTMDEVSSVVPRTDGEYEAFTKALPDFPTSSILKANSDGTIEDATNSASAVITGNPQFTKWIVMGGNEESVVGAIRALESAGVDSDSAAIGMGAYLAQNEFEQNTALKAAPYFSAEEVGGTAALELIDYIQNGTEIPEKKAVDAQIVTPEDYKEIMNIK